MKSIKRITRLTAGLLSLAFLAYGCNRSSSNRYAAMPDPEDTTTLKTYTALRLDKEVMRLKPSEAAQGMQRLLDQYGPLFDMYLQHGIEVGTATVTDSAGNTSLNTETAATLGKEILANPGYQTFFRAEDSVYASGLAPEMNLFTTAMRRLHSYLPQAELPKQVVAMFSCFGPKLAVGDGNELMVSMEYYIGSGFKPYRYVDGIYAYDSINLSRKMLVRDMVNGWCQYNYPNGQANSSRLIDEMVYQGKLMYLLEACLPQMRGEDLMGYSTDQWDWCEQNERNMWTSVKESRHLYTFDRLTISKYINPAPHTVFFPFDAANDATPESPGKAGIWLGWRIVGSYMKNNPGVTMEQLFALADSQQLLEDSGYNPK